MKAISVREFRNSSAAVLNAVEAGESVRITRNGTEIAEVRPVQKRRSFVPLRELWQAFQTLPAAGDFQKFRRDQDDFFGDDGDRL